MGSPTRNCSCQLRLPQFAILVVVGLTSVVKRWGIQIWWSRRPGSNRRERRRCRVELLCRRQCSRTSRVCPEDVLLGRLTNRIQYEQEMARVRYSPEQADLL